jgi:ABC-type nitrate/sulfonate/bicarbonate transport system substrate-binding protein
MFTDSFRRIYTVIAVFSILLVWSFTSSTTAQGQVLETKSEITTLRQGYFNGVGLPAIFAAIDQGYFEKEGIRIALTSFTSGPAEITALIGGSLDVTHADIIGWATAIAGGQSLYLITPGSQAQTPQDDFTTQRIAVPKTSSIKSIADLKGKRIGVGGSPLAKVSTILWLEREGVDPSTVDFEVVNRVSTLPSLLAMGTVAAVLCGDPMSEQLERDPGITTLGFPLETVPKDSAFTGVVSTIDFVRQNPDLIRRYVRAFRLGAAYFNAASQVERARIVTLGDFNLADLTPKLPEIVEQFRYNKASDKPINIAATQQWVDIAAKYGGMPKTVDIAPFVWTTAKEEIR